MPQVEIINANANQFKLYAQMIKNWSRDYKKAGDNVKKYKPCPRVFAQHVKDNEIRFLLVDGEVAGMVTLNNMFNNITKTYYEFIEIVYVVEHMRGQGIAKKARQILVQQGLAGTVVSYGRVQKNIKYFTECGFTHITEAPKQRGTDLGLCVLLTSPCGDSKPLNLFGVIKSREDAEFKSLMTA